ncbi:MAG: alpha/beta hydrolase [Myxococcales bacterium]|nr:alpha/beta hydrolase [Myxococcales bacterium]
MPYANPQEEKLIAADRHQIFLRHWPVENPKAVVVICHGLGEHGGRYQNPLGRFLPAGYAAFAHDHRGHGRSDGRRGHVDRFDQFLDDTYQVVVKAGETYPGKKIFVYGHSLGGLIALAYALRHPDTIDGVISSSPALKLSLEVPKAKATLGTLVSRIWPTLTLANEIDANGLSHDATVVKEYLDDPLVHDKVSAKFFVEFQAAMARVLLGAGALRMPLLMTHGSEDPLTSPAGSREFFDHAGSADKTYQLYEGQLHEVHNDTQKEQLLDLLVGWLDRHSAA